jgi:DNA repair exonuclease SbcCD ATPase subunit
MITFKKLTFKNFLAVGEKPVEINLDSGRLYLISGLNGSGKSTIIDAIVYAIYGVAHRPRMILSSLVNETNKKKMVVTLELDNGQNEYKIVRGEKPKKFEIFKDGKLMDKFSTADLMNKYIAVNVVGQDKDMFLQLSVIGKSNYEPPLELSAGKRREFVEKIFNMFILSKMKDILKDTTRETNAKKDELTVSVQKKQLEIQYANKLIAQAEEARDDQLAAIQEEISALEEEISKLEDEYREFSFDQSLYGDLDKSLKSLRQEDRTLNRALWALESSLERQEVILSSLDDKDAVCPSCGQNMPHVDHTEERHRISGEILALQMQIASSKQEIANSLKERVQIEAVLEELQQQKSQKDSILAQARVQTRNLDMKKSQRDKLAAPVAVDVDLDKLTEELTDLEEEREIYVERLSYFKYFRDDFLADSGYKAFVLSRYFPEITKAVNALLSDYDLNYTVEIEEDFTFKIFNLKGKEIPYARFSEGQKQRMNLSVWEAFMAVAKARRNVQTNLIIFDEILDGSMDADGQEVFLNSLQSKIEKYGMTGFIISHGMDNFEKNIRVSMLNGFSHYDFEEALDDSDS